MYITCLRRPRGVYQSQWNTISSGSPLEDLSRDPSTRYKHLILVDFSLKRACLDMGVQGACE